MAMKNNIMLFVSIFSCACHPAQLEDDEKQILQLHALQREYHFRKDSLAFMNQLSDDFISVNKGLITHPKREETLQRYHRYFDSVEFEKWDDVTPPIVRFSDDHSIAYTVVDKMVKTQWQDGDGQTVTDSTHFAWTAIYRKEQGIWKIDCVTSTQRP